MWAYIKNNKIEEIIARPKDMVIDDDGDFSGGTQTTEVASSFSSDKLRARELKIFYAVHLWLTHEESRVEHASELMKSVRFQLIEPENIEDLSSRITYMTNNAQCMRLLLDAQMYHMLPNKQILQLRKL